MSILSVIFLFFVIIVVGIFFITSSEDNNVFLSFGLFLVLLSNMILLWILSALIIPHNITETEYVLYRKSENTFESVNKETVLFYNSYRTILFDKSKEYDLIKNGVWFCNIDNNIVKIKIKKIHINNILGINLLIDDKFEVLETEKGRIICKLMLK